MAGAISSTILIAVLTLGSVLPADAQYYERRPYNPNYDPPSRYRPYFRRNFPPGQDYVPGWQRRARPERDRSPYPNHCYTSREYRC